ncbi:MAG: DUF554 domain-containing protein [Treponema sp.]|jgi:uncharacterized membrane protein YqgA involved in biofilm formation|nr:DUF554 domain-containing protein [Treponema sp.]
MLGPVVNALTVLICSLLGCFVIRGIPKRFEETLKKGIGLAVVYLGIRGALDNRRTLLLIMSLVAGALLGEFIDIDRRMNRLGIWAERKLGSLGRRKSASPRGRGFAGGFVSASILFCTGSMALVGSMQSGLTGNHGTLYAKSILDGSISLIFGASLGIGTAFSALTVLIYQGGIALLSMTVKDSLSPAIINEMSAVGNLLVAAIGFNFVSAGKAGKIRVANLVPAVFIPWIYMTLEGLVRS